MSAFVDYFDTRKTSSTADKLQGFLNFLATDAPGAKIDRLTLHSFEKFYGPDGDVRIPRELERVRRLMLHRSKVIHGFYDGIVKDEIKRLSKELLNLKDPTEIRKLKDEIKILIEFLGLPWNLEIKNSAIEEISNRLKARNIRSPRELNRPPDGEYFGLCSMIAPLKDSGTGAPCGSLKLILTRGTS